MSTTLRSVNRADCRRSPLEMGRNIQSGRQRRRRVCPLTMATTGPGPSRSVLARRVAIALDVVEAGTAA
jgi:hypothetical protein